MSTIRFLFTVSDTLTNATSVVLSDAAGAFGVKRDDTDAVVVADGTAMTNSATGTYTHTFDDPSGFTGSTYTYAIETVYGGETYRWQYTMDGPTAAGILTADTDLVRYDPSITRLLDSDYSQTGFSTQRTEALTWLNRCIDVHYPELSGWDVRRGSNVITGIDESESYRAAGYLVENADLERAAAYYALYLIYEANIKQPGDDRDVKAAHFKQRAYETLNNAVIEFDTDGDDQTDIQYHMSSPRLGRG